MHALLWLFICILNCLFLCFLCYLFAYVELSIKNLFTYLLTYRNTKTAHERLNYAPTSSRTITALGRLNYAPASSLAGDENRDRDRKVAISKPLGETSVARFIFGTK